MMKAIKTVKAEKKMCFYLGLNQNQKRFFALSGLKKSESKFVSIKSSTFLRISFKIRIEGFEPVVRDRNEFEYRSTWKLRALFETSDYQVSDASAKVNDFSIKSTSTKINRSIESPREKKPVVTLKVDFQYSRIFLEF